MFEEVCLTLIHEAGHYFGLSEEEIEAIEDEFWYGGRGSESAEAVRRSTFSSRRGWRSSSRRSIRSRTRPSSKSARAGARSPSRSPREPAALVAVEIDRDLAAGLTARERSPRVEIVEADILDRRARDARAAAGNARRRQSALQHLVADPRAGWSRLQRATGSAARRDADAAARGRRSTRRPARARATTAPLAILLGLAATRRATADAAARRVSAGAEGDVGGGAPHVPLRRDACDALPRRARQSLVRQAFTQAPEDARQRACRAALPCRAGWTAPLLRRAGIDGRRRPETLAPDEWVALARRRRRNSAE